MTAEARQNTLEIRYPTDATGDIEAIWPDGRHEIVKASDLDAFKQQITANGWTSPVTVRWPDSDGSFSEYYKQN